MTLFVPHPVEIDWFAWFGGWLMFRMTAAENRQKENHLCIFRYAIA